MILTILRRGALLLVLAIVLPFALAAQQATGTVSGRVTDASVGRGLPDVAVLVTGSRLGTLTGPNGEYTISGVPVGARTLTIRRIGYQPTTETVTVVPGATATADVALHVSAVNLSEVVVTGTGTATTTVTASPSTITVGETVGLTATVQPTSTTTRPTSTITFLDGTTPLSSSPVALTPNGFASATFPQTFGTTDPTLTAQATISTLRMPRTARSAATPCSPPAL